MTDPPDFEFSVDYSDRFGWAVSLPHQCDDWEITDRNFRRPTDLRTAIARMEAFVAQANEALERLRQGRPT